MTGEQLAFDFDAAAQDQDELVARIRANVTEDGMTEAEVEAALAGALEQLDLAADGVPPAEPRRCMCDHPLVFRDEFGDGRCGLCGKGPRR